MGGEEFKWRTISYATSKTVQLKPMIKAHSSGRMVSSGISDHFSTLWENPSEKVDDDEMMMMMMMMIMNKSQEVTVFSGRQ